MGAPSTKQVGGGADTKTADQYQTFLQGQLGTNAPGQAIGNLLNGTTSPTAYQSSGMSSTLPGAPNFTSTNFNPLNTNLNLSQFNSQSGSTGVPGFSQLLNTAQQGLKPLQNYQSSAGGNPGQLAQIGVGNVNQPNADVLSSRAQTIKSIIDQQNALNLANTRQYFSAGGMGSQGSGAMLANAQQQAYGQNQLLQGLQGVTQQDIGNTLNFGQLNTQNQLAAQGLQNTQQLGNYQISNQASMANAANNLQAAMGLGQLGMSGLNTALSGATSGAGLNLQGLGLNSQNAMNQFGMNNNATQTMNQNSFQNNNAMNQLLSQLFGQQSQNALGNQSLGNSFGLGASGQGIQGFSNALQALMGGFNQANAIGTPQSQTVQTPSGFSQFMSGVGQLAPYALAPFTGGASLAGAFGGVNPFGGGGSQMMAPNNFNPSTTFGLNNTAQGYAGSNGFQMAPQMTPQMMSPNLGNLNLGQINSPQMMAPGNTQNLGLGVIQ